MSLFRRRSRSLLLWVNIIRPCVDSMTLEYTTTDTPPHWVHMMSDRGCIGIDDIHIINVYGFVNIGCYDLEAKTITFTPVHEDDVVVDYVPPNPSMIHFRPSSSQYGTVRITYVFRCDVTDGHLLRARISTYISSARDGNINASISYSCKSCMALHENFTVWPCCCMYTSPYQILSHAADWQ